MLQVLNLCSVISLATPIRRCLYVTVGKSIYPRGSSDGGHSSGDNFANKAIHHTTAGCLTSDDVCCANTAARWRGGGAFNHRILAEMSLNSKLQNRHILIHIIRFYHGKNQGDDNLVLKIIYLLNTKWPHCCGGFTIIYYYC